MEYASFQKKYFALYEKNRTFAATMKLTLLVVGRTTSPALQTLIDDYRNRLTHYFPFSLQVIADLKQAKSLNEAQIKQAEGEQILKAVPTNAMMILLDERGKQFRSIELADYLQRCMTAGRDIYFVVGGPYGFSEAVYRRANDSLSLSRLTFSHQMIRLLFVEQLYRAATILRGEPYHHE